MPLTYFENRPNYPTSRYEVIFFTYFSFHGVIKLNLLVFQNDLMKYRKQAWVRVILKYIQLFIIKQMFKSE